MSCDLQSRICYGKEWAKALTHIDIYLWKHQNISSINLFLNTFFLNARIFRCIVLAQLSPTGIYSLPCPTSHFILYILFFRKMPCFKPSSSSEKCNEKLNSWCRKFSLLQHWILIPHGSQSNVRRLAIWQQGNSLGAS